MFAGPTRRRPVGLLRPGSWPSPRGRRRLSTARATITLAAIALVGCSATETSDPTLVPEVVETVGFETSDFCRRMLDLERSDPTIDEVVDVYRDLLASAPPEIAGDMAVVLAELTGGSIPPTTTDTTDDALDELDDRVPAAMPDPAQVIATYIDEVCRSTVVNPLPGPTDPP